MANNAVVKLITIASFDSYCDFLHWFGLDSLTKERKTELYNDNCRAVERENKRILSESEVTSE